jgi:capsular exopolysaccharide synthesis family protein
MLAVLGVALFFGVTAAFVRESFDETVRTPQDMADIHGLTMPGYIPRLMPLSSEDPGAGGSQLITNPGSPFSEAFRALRTSIGLVLDMSRPRTMLITSALGGAGKTTITYNLGVAFAQQGMRVILVDADLRNPDLHRLFSAPQTPGLSEACMQSMQTETQGIVQHAALPTLFMLPAGKRPQLPAEVLGSAAFDSLIRKLSNQYDYVLIDSPPILAVTDASIIATKVKAVVAVIRSRSTTRLALSALVQAIRRTHAPTFSFVLNDVQNPTLDGFYEYSYARGKGDQIAANV